MEKQLDTSWVNLRKGVLEIMRHAIGLKDYQYARTLKNLSAALREKGTPTLPTVLPDEPKPQSRKEFDKEWNATWERVVHEMFIHD